MPTLSDYTSGTITLTNGSADFTGTGTGWLSAGFREGDVIFDVPGATEFMGVIETITGEGTGTLTQPWEGPTLAGVSYRMRFMSDGSRMTAAARQLIEQLGNGNVQALAGLIGAANKVLAFTGPGAMGLIDRSELINGVRYDVQVDALADRDAYDGQAAGYAVLVSDVGDGRSAIYSKNSATSADWSDPAYVTGPVGPASTIPGVVWQGTYAPATTYATNDGVLYNGSSWRAKVATTGNAPPNPPATSNTWWELLARAGQDGTGTGDVVGPASSVDQRIAVFSGTTGKLLADSGMTLADLAPDGYDDLQFTVSQLALLAADNSNMALFLGPNGNQVADSFDALTFVDVAGATNLDTSQAGVLRATMDGTTGTTVTIGAPDGSVTTTYNGTLIDRTSIVPNGVLIVRIGVYSTAPGNMRVKVYQRLDGTTGTIVVDQAFAHPGGGWADCILSSPYTVPASGTFIIGASNPSGVSMNITTARARTFKAGDLPLGPASGMTDDTASVWVLRYGHSPTVRNNLTVRSASFTASAVPTKMKALINVREVDAAVAGTDYTLECSRDGGTTWTAMSLTERYSSENLRVVEGATTDVSGQPSGAAPRWRFKTLNNKNVELHGVYLYWS